MEEQEDDIALLFKNAFDGHKAPLGDASWEALNHSLGTRNFYRFNPYQFNIYYASSIIACLFICLGVGTHYTYKQWKEETQPVVSVQSTVATPTESSIIVQEDTRTTVLASQEVKAQPEKERAAKKEDRSKQELLKEEPQKNTVGKEAKTTLSKSDSTQVTPSAAHPAAPLKTDSISKPKRTLYITKRDTIFKVDTIKTHKKQKRWF